MEDLSSSRTPRISKNIFTTPTIRKKSDYLHTPLTKDQLRSIKKSVLGPILKAYPKSKKPIVLQLYTRLPPTQFQPLKQKDLTTFTFLKQCGQQSIYSGQYNHQGQKHGLGLLVLLTGQIFQGYFQNNQISGQGRFISQAGIIYQGKFDGLQIKSDGKITYLQQQKVYQGQVQQNIPHGFGEQFRADGSRYIGNFRFGIKHGKGKYIWPNGSTYEGDIQYCKIQGFGRYHWCDGSHYVGQWRNNKMNGRGVYTWRSGKVYRGFFKDGIHDGFGEMKWPSGKYYKGWWEQNLQDGEGTEVDSEGRIRQGIWVLGKFDGESTTDQTKEGTQQKKAGISKDYPDLLDKVRLLRKAKNLHKITKDNLRHLKKKQTEFSDMHDQESYMEEVKQKKIQEEQEIKRLLKKEQRLSTKLTQKEMNIFLNNIDCPFQNNPFFERLMKNYNQLPPFQSEDQQIDFPESNQFHQYWIHINSEKIYKGEVVNQNIPHGRGVLIHQAVIYQGSWLQGKRHGLGREISIKGQVYEGYWIKGKKNGFGMKITQKGTQIYVGEFLNDLFHGQGSIRTKQGLYNGTWDHGKQHGEGVLELDDGKVYQGAFEKGVIHGFGCLTHPNGVSYTGVWKKGKPTAKIHKGTNDINHLVEFFKTIPNQQEVHNQISAIISKAVGQGKAKIPETN